MPRTYDIIVVKSGTESHSVNADSPKHAYELFNEGVATLKADETDGVESIKIIDRATGEEFHPDSFDEGDPGPQLRTYGVRYWLTFRVAAEREVEAYSCDEAISKAKAIDLDDLEYSLSHDDMQREGDETAIIYGPDDEDLVDYEADAWSGDGHEIDLRKDGEPFSWVACEIVKDLAKLAGRPANSETMVELNALVVRAAAACTRESADG